MRSLLCMLVAALISLLPAFAQALELNSIAPLISHKTRLMLFSPHPDDVTLGAGGLIERVLETGGTVRVVYMTNGDGFPDGVEMEYHVSSPSRLDFNKYGALRQKEAREAMATLGVRGRNVVFLGFPDGGLPSLFVKSCTPARPFRSPFTGRFRPAAFNTIVVPHTDYCAQDVRNEIERELLYFKPTLVMTTGPGDQHPDHEATYRFVKQALAQLARGHSRIHPLMLTFLIHYDGWPLDQEKGPGTRLDPPIGFSVHGIRWIPFPLTPGEVAVKREAVLKYRSQELIMKRFLLGFVRSNELFMAGK